MDYAPYIPTTGLTLFPTFTDILTVKNTQPLTPLLQQQNKKRYKNMFFKKDKKIVEVLASVENIKNVTS